MKLWMRKIFVALIAVITLGLYIPEFDADVEAEQSKEEIDPNSDFHDKTGINDHHEMPILTADPFESYPEQSAVDPMLALSEKATEQAMIKMGPRIAGKVEAEFRQDILPSMEEALHMIMQKKTEVQYYSITEQPSDGFGERIFNIYDERTGKDIARFDVRRVKRPMEGYWFNFHYHVSSDGFDKHHEIGEIYWDKNIPPRWMT
ncbi:YpjP-like protein [Lentibacillus halodurans]|uniref:YpjP-like protein n=1 Tax=Lentibacillus halodurans TaxID=237679 RepID=A0A1I0ZXA0_9BACI|nr:YpjP family protein [Lentibacillus halodurans]SFB30395.1 YpjP-like protein [Lentibacillus halodurans]